MSDIMERMQQGISLFANEYNMYPEKVMISQFGMEKLRKEEADDNIFYPKQIQGMKVITNRTLPDRWFLLISDEKAKLMEFDRAELEEPKEEEKPAEDGPATPETPVVDG